MPFQIKAYEGSGRKPGRAFLTHLNNLECKRLFVHHDEAVALLRGAGLDPTE